MEVAYLWPPWLTESYHPRSTPSVGFDNVDAVECARRNIWVTNGAGSITETTADLALCLLLGATRRLGANHMMVVEGTPKGSENRRKWFVGESLGAELTSKTLGVVGFGRIGQALGRKCQAAFNMRVLYFDAFHVQSGVTGAEAVSFDELLAESDFISINSQLDASTHHMFGAAQFAAMKPGSFLVNAARGPLVDEEALCDALESGHLGGAGLDVYEIEPPDENPDGSVGPSERLRRAPNIFLQPHSGSATLEARREMQVLCTRNLKAVLIDGSAPLTPVNRPAAPKILAPAKL